MPQPLEQDRQDAYGAAIFDYYCGQEAVEIVERDDGFIIASSGPAIYFADYNDWHPQERIALRNVSGRVLDIGCGAGRHSLYLQSRSHSVMAIDSSPLAIKVCRQRGITNAHVLTASQLTLACGKFDLMLLMGNNLGLLRNRNHAHWLL